MLCNLEVDVNGQESFYVSTKLLASFSCKLRKLFKNSALANSTRILKLIFHEFPGGPEGFELILKFCYNGGIIDITPSNVLLLHYAAKFLEINEDQTKKYLESVHFWTLSEILDCLKQFQELQFSMNSTYVVQEILDALVEKISILNIQSPFPFSCSENSSIQFSGDISTNSDRCSSFQTTNWLRDLEFLNIVLFEKVLSTMIFSKKLDHGMVLSFILHYQKVKFIGMLPHDDQKCKIIEILINFLCSVNGNFNFPFRRLCDMLQVCSTSTLGKFWVKKVERIIGLRIDEATLDDLLVPSPSKRACAYDVNLILRLLKIFLGQRGKNLFVQRLKKAGLLMDLYLAEVAPDPHLKPCKFLALVLCLPGAARESHDRVCEAIDMYFKVHKLLNEEEKIKICSALDYDKLSAKSLRNLAKNAKFPSCVTAAALVFLKSKLKTKPEDVKNLQVIWNSSISANEQLLVQLSKGKECRKMLKKSANNVARTDVKCPTNGKSLPRLCS